MNLLGVAAAALAKRRLARLRTLALAPATAQERVWRRLVTAARSTQFGREHGFAAFRSPRDFQRAVPLRDYALHRRWFDLARRGTPDVSWPGHVRHFAISSGTTSGEKYLPVSDATIRSNRGGGFDSLVPHLARERGELFAGKLLFLGGATQLRAEGQVWIGDNTGILGRHVPWPLSRLRVPCPGTLRLSDWLAKIERSAEEALAADVRLLAGVPSWILLFAERVLELARARGRAVDRLEQLWPNLKLFVHGGVSFAPYADRVRETLGGGVETLDTYSASEGGMLGVQDRREEDTMLWIPDRGVLYEFVPATEVDSALPTRHLLHEAEPEIDYAVVLSTDSGIFAYLLGDLVRFERGPEKRFRFAGRIAHTLNAFGEHLSGPEIENALLAASATQGARPIEHSVAAVFPDARCAEGRHRYYVEFSPPPGDLPAFVRTFDTLLAQGNEDYATHRRFGIRSPEFFVVPEGTYFEWMRARGRLGGQNKVPRVLGPELEASLRTLLVTKDAAVLANPARA